MSKFIGLVEGYCIFLLHHLKQLPLINQQKESKLINHQQETIVKYFIETKLDDSNVRWGTCAKIPQSHDDYIV